jgi:hypothetical protein
MYEHDPTIVTCAVMYYLSQNRNCLRLAHHSTLVSMDGFVMLMPCISKGRCMPSIGRVNHSCIDIVGRTPFSRAME